MAPTPTGRDWVPQALAARPAASMACLAEFVRGADVEDDGICLPGHISGPPHAWRHDWRGADGQRGIGAVIDGNDVGQVMHQRALQAQHAEGGGDLLGEIHGENFLAADGRRGERCQYQSMK